MRKIMVKGTNQAEDMHNRILQIIVQVVNQAVSKQATIMVKRLQSGDMVITFAEAIKAYVLPEGWETKAFGDRAKATNYTYIVLAKGLLAQQIKATHTELMKLLESI